MSDSGSGGGQFASEMKSAVVEAVKDTKDAVGEMVEQGVQSISGTNLTPQQIQAKQQSDQKIEIDRQKKLAYTRAWLSNLTADQNKVIAENKRKESERLNEQKREVQVSEMKKEEKKKTPANGALANVNRAELRKGVGG